MTQVKKFYLASFLKNQIYFVPILVLFFQDLGLDYSQIFWIFTFGSVFAFIIEIPTGVIADIYGKRGSIILSKFVIFASFVAFGFAFNFWSLLLANLLFELGKAFRSGTETAFVYNYLAKTKGAPVYTKVKSQQKFYARISEAIATAGGGYIAYKFGFSEVFFLAAIPAFINFLETLSWEKISENTASVKQVNWKKYFNFSRNSLQEVLKNSQVRNVVLNVAIFSSVFVAVDKFIQPYMKNAGVELQYFGLVYAGFLIITAWLVKYSYKLEQLWGGERMLNLITIVAFIPLLILGSGVVAWWGIGLLFLVMVLENVRSPIANTVFHQRISAENRATMGSVLALFKSSSKLIVLPITGYMADFYSLSFAILILGIVIILNTVFFWIKPKIAH